MTTLHVKYEWFRDLDAILKSWEVKSLLAALRSWRFGASEILLRCTAMTRLPARLVPCEKREKGGKKETEMMVSFTFRRVHAVKRQSRKAGSIGQLLIASGV